MTDNQISQLKASLPPAPGTFRSFDPVTIKVPRHVYDLIDRAISERADLLAAALAVVAAPAGPPGSDTEAAEAAAWTAAEGALRKAESP